ncbi:hypothetical protein ACTHS7_10885, partial [Neisseria sp. P0015.S009]|uniref:hypothetical protein n=1 Tax=Neisseria sp. P0015.S009 TaxID=3436765 RepID=UPI003F7ED0C3
MAIGGAADDGHVYWLRPIVWSGSNWATKTDLGTLRTDNTGFSLATAVSDDGSIVVGSATSDSEVSRAIVWSGSNWADKKDLGTLKRDNSGESNGNAVSGDGSLVVGDA